MKSSAVLNHSDTFLARLLLHSFAKLLNENQKVIQDFVVLRKLDRLIVKCYLELFGLTLLDCLLHTEGFEERKLVLESFQLLGL